MAVTYNWSYKPGVANKYGFTIAASADDVKPSNAVYVAHWGNDVQGNGSRIKPYRTLLKGITAVTAAGYIILGNGVYRENIGTNLNIVASANIVGDGNVTIDSYSVGGFLSVQNPLSNLFFYNIIYKNATYQTQTNTARPITFIDCSLFSFSCTVVGNSAPLIMRNCLIVNSCLINRADFTSDFRSCTIINTFVGFTSNSLLINLKDNIFYNCNLAFSTPLSSHQIGFCLFFQCNVLTAGYTTTGLVANTNFYPTTPSGYTYINNITTLRSLFTGHLSPLPYCAVADPSFNNISIEDYTLSLSSPARNMSYFGTYVGVYSIAKALAVKSTASLSDFDNASAVNLNITDNSLTLTDRDNNAAIVTKSIDNTTGRELQRIIVHGINADRNGEYVDATADLASATISAGTTLTASTPYLVEVGSITYDGVVYTAGQRFTSKATSVGTFTTSTSGVLREILEAPARENVEARFSDGAGSTVDNTATLEELAWYFVEGNTATYNGDTYAVGTFIKVLTGITSFTGSGLLRKVFSDTDPYFYFEINQKPTTNNTGNVRTGAIVRGNGDKDFDRTAANVFPINKKFIQLRYTIQVNNLTP